MQEENTQRKTTEERQSELLITALENAAKNGGILLNGTQKASPRITGKMAFINPVNALMMAMHSDQGGFSTNVYTTFKQLQSKKETVMKGEKGLPFTWVNRNTYVEKDNPENKVSRAQYAKMTDEEKDRYRENPREDSLTLFNVEQSNRAKTNDETHQQLVKQWGTAEQRGEAVDSKNTRMMFNHFLLMMRDNLLPIRKDGQGEVNYEMKKDTLHIPAQKDFSTYAEYVQAVTRQIVHATGIPQRLAREGVALDGRRQPSEQQQLRETLVEELSSAHRQLEYGMAARLRPETVEAIPKMVGMLKDDPSLVKAVLHDVNRTVGMIKKAENGVKITLHAKPSEQRLQDWTAQFSEEQPLEKFSKINMLKDDEGRWVLAAKPEKGNTFTVRPTKEDVGLFFDVLKNDLDNDHVKLFQNQFAQKYHDIIAASPDKELHLFKGDASDEALSLINKVNIYRDKDSKPMLSATIGGERQNPVEITQSQWQRMWLADDMRDYKTRLAASLYADSVNVKLKEREQEEHRENYEQHDEQKTPAQKEQEQREEKAKEEATREETRAIAGVVTAPMLKQFHDLKKKHPDALLLFRTGDHYESYMDDAKKASSILGIETVTSDSARDANGKSVEVLSFAHYDLDTNLPKLIRAGERVAICDQLEAPRQKQHEVASRDGEEERLTVEKEEKQDKNVAEERPRGMHR